MSINLSALQKQRRDTAANWTAENPTLLAGEIGIESDTGYWKVGDGSTAWTSLTYVPALGAKVGVPDGTAAAPAVFFADDTNTGIYSPGADQVAISTNGTGRLFVNASGNLGLNKSPAVTIDAQSTGSNCTFALNRTDASVAGQLQISSGTNANSVLSTGTKDIFFSTNSLERLRITSDGKVGLGTSSPTELLEIKSNTAPTFRINNGTATLGTDQEIGSLEYYTNDSTVSGGINGTGIAASIVAFSENSFGVDTYLSFRTRGDQDATANANERLRIDSQGRVGVGTTSPAANLDVAGAGTQTIRSITTDVSGSAIGRLRAVYTGGGGGTQTAIDLRAGNGYGYLLAESNVPLLLGTNNTERARIDSSGRLLVGTSTSASAGNASAARIQIVGNTIDSSASSVLALNRGEAATSITSGETIGNITFGDSAGNEFGLIQCIADGTAGSGDYPGRLTFSTCGDGQSSPTERMRITNSGGILLGCTAAPNPGQPSTTSGFAINGTGNDGYITAKIDNGPVAYFRRDGTDGTLFEIRKGSTTVGTIAVTASATAYNTSSDYRLKENVTAVTDGITRLQQLKPSRFNFIADPTKTVDGFLAHEVQTVVPEAITGEKDAVDDEGNPEYQGIDQSKLVPLLTAALQEAVAEINALKDRLTAAGI